MKVEDFYKTLKERFPFEKTWAEFPVLEDNTHLIFEDKEGTKYNIGNLEYQEANADLHFRVATIMADEGESFFYVSEPGEDQGCIFLNDHEEGIFSIEELLDEDDIEELGPVDTAAYIASSYEEKKEFFRFFEYKLADSLEELLAGIKIVTKEEYNA